MEASCFLSLLLSVSPEGRPNLTARVQSRLTSLSRVSHVGDAKIVVSLRVEALVGAKQTPHGDDLGLGLGTEGLDTKSNRRTQHQFNLTHVAGKVTKFHFRPSSHGDDS